MNYKRKLIGITGVNGFIGSELFNELFKAGALIETIDGDIRYPETFDRLNYNFDYLFHFAAPSSQVLFARNPDYCSDVTLQGFINAAEACKRTGTKLIYPSTGLLSQGKSNAYADCKRMCEMYVKARGIDAIGIRIFATYGPGEAHKRDYASVPYLFARDIVGGKAPIIFGDGQQVRDFIYIDDVVQSIMHLAEECNDPVVDVGSGLQVSFNELIEEINYQASPNRTIRPLFVEKPGGYVEETMADPSRLQDFYMPQIGIHEGIRRVVEALINERDTAAKGSEGA